MAIFAVYEFMDVHSGPAQIPTMAEVGIMVHQTEIHTMESSFVFTRFSFAYFDTNKLCVLMVYI